MSRGADTLTALELRRSFDTGFASLPAELASDYEDFLIVRLGSNRFALRLAEVSLVEAVRKIVPVQGSALGLLGLAGVRGRLLGVFSLAVLVGEPASGAPQWLCLHGKPEESVALGVDAVEALVRAPRSAIAPMSSASEHGAHASAVLHTDSGSHVVLDLVSALANVHEGRAVDSRKDR